MSGHLSVLTEKLLGFAPAKTGVFLDLTFGLGGHSKALLKKFPDAEGVGVDRDESMLNLARRSPGGDSLSSMRLVCANFAEAAESMVAEGFKADFAVLDLGLNSAQLDDASRGFSFMREGPLDMRMNSDESLMTAAEIVNRWSEEDLADLFWKYGEERFSRKIARRIVETRRSVPFETTSELVSLLEKSTPRRHGERKAHPATKVFQALRICVNREIESLEKVLDFIPLLLSKGGRAAVISFHSLEDRPVKHRFRIWSSDCVCDPSAPVCVCDHRKTAETITKKPVTADSRELLGNPRSRSAKLRVVEKI